VPPRETVVDLAPVSRHLLGRRRHGRRAVQHEVECANGRKCLVGRVLDLSRTGALICLSEPQFTAATDTDLFGVAGRLAFMFSEGLQLLFVHSKVVARARIVRVARREAKGPTVIGCEFSRALTFNECRVLGIPSERIHAAGA
jgi:hypothetical protein